MTFGMQAYRGRKVLVTGHTGFKGSWLCEWLLSLGAEVAGFSISIPTSPSHFEEIDLASRMKDYRGDIRDLEAFQNCLNDFRPSVVFHLAAQALVRDSYESPKETFDVNVGGTVNVLEAIRRVSFVEAAVIVTTDKCYQNKEWEFGYREIDPLGGKDPYSGSKGAAEIVFSSYAQSFFLTGAHTTRVASARAGNVIGSGDWAKDRIVPDCVRAWNKEGAGTKPNAVCIRSPRSTRPWQHVLEPLSGYLVLGAALLSNKTGELDGINGESFNFGPGSDANRTVEELLIELKTTWSQASWTVDETQTKGKSEAKLLKLVCDKAEARLKWKPTLNFSEGVEMTSLGYQSKTPKTLELIQTYEKFANQRGIEQRFPVR